jgi:cobalt-zinc-cadmium efflux system outer membrane protein
MSNFKHWCARLRAAPSIFALVLAAAFAPVGESVAQPLTLADALLQAAAADPSFQAADASISAAEASVRQADVRPNPSVGLEVENFAGSGPFGVFEQSHTTLSYAQKVERGNKRAARVSLARAGLQSAEIEKQVYAVELFERVETAYVEAVAAEAEVALSAERLAAAQRLQAETMRRVAAAREPEFAGARVQALVAETEIALVHAQSNARTTKATLAAYWDGGPEMEFNPSWFEEIDVNTAMMLGEDNIDLALLSAERDRAKAQIVLEESHAVQDPTFAGGIRHFAQGGDIALVAQVAIPLPLYNDNSGNIARAMAERSAAEHAYAAQRRNIQRELTTLQARVAAHSDEAEALEASAIPQAERALELIREGFERGAFEYIDIIDAERNVNNAQTQRLGILRDFHLDMARLNRLTGRHLSAFAAGEVR